MKKYLLFFAAFALLIVGCAQNDIVENRSEKNAIGFRTLNDKVTRAANDSKSQYGVFAKWSKSTDWFMSDVTVTTDADNKDSYSPLQYWPHEGTVSFYAYAPQGRLENASMTPDPGFTMGYTVPTDAQEDFTVATPDTVNTEETGFTGVDPVELNFNHMLSKISVDAVLSQALLDANYTVDFKTANLVVKYNTGTVDIMAQNPALAHVGDQGSYTYTEKTSYMFVPQSSIGVTLQLVGVKIMHNEVIVWPAQGDSENELVGNLAVYPFAADDIMNDKDNNDDYPNKDKFLAGKHYKVTFTINNNAIDGEGGNVFNPAISFSSSVADWDTELGKGVPVDQPNGARP